MVIEIAHRIGRRGVQLRVIFGRGIGRIFADKAPKPVLVLGPGNAGKVQKHCERHHHVGRGRLSVVDMPDRIGKLARIVLIRERPELLVIFVHCLRDHVPPKPLRRLGLLVHEIAKALRRRVGQPFVDGQPVALRLRNLLPLLVQEQLIGEMLRLLAAQNLADAVIDRRIGAVILAVHLEIDTQRRPTRAEIGLPLQLHLPARHRQRPFAALFVVEGDGMVLLVDMLDRDIKHPPRFRVDRQEAGIGLLTFLAQGRQHDLHDLLITLDRKPQRVVEPAGLVELGRRIELILKPERIQKPAQHGVVVVAKACVFAEGIGDGGQGLLDIGLQQLLLRHVLRHLPHPVHVVGKADQPGRDVADDLEGAADHRRALHLAKGADMRQAGRAIAGLEQHMALFRGLLLVPFQNAARLLERPGFGIHGGVAQRRHDRTFPMGGIPYAAGPSLLNGRRIVNNLPVIQNRGKARATNSPVVFRARCACRHHGHGLGLG